MLVIWLEHAQAVVHFDLCDPVAVFLWQPITVAQPAPENAPVVLEFSMLGLLGVLRGPFQGLRGVVSE